MNWLWPGLLLLLGLIPLLIAAYIWILRRRRRFTVRFSSLSLIRAAQPRYSRWRRHLPFALFLLALASLVLAVARPVAIVSVPAGQVSIVLAVDVSRSMCSTDIAPSRIEAATDAALSFVQRQQVTTQISIVAFSGFAELVQAPTTDQELLQAAIESLTTGRRTAIGSAILKSLDTIAELDPSIPPTVRGSTPDPGVTPVPQGAYAPHIVVLLTDGASNVGPAPLEAADQAVDRGVRVYTIGFGTADGSDMPRCPEQFLGTEPWSGGGGGMFGGGGGRWRRGIDEETLQQVADMTGGTYHSAESADQLQAVFEGLPTYLITKHETTEISVIFAGIGALLALLAVVLSMRWQPML
jgi:Ca-activated chloride channel homolog